MNGVRFALLTLSAFRLTRLITTDKWPPTKRFREWIEERTGEESGWSEFIGCGWCAGTVITGVVFITDRYLWSPSIWLLSVVAAMSLVGYLSAYDER